MFDYLNSPGFNSSSDKGCLLNGSVWEFSKWRKIIDFSIIVPLGNTTGSSNNVSINGSVIKINQVRGQR